MDNTVSPPHWDGRLLRFRWATCFDSCGMFGLHPKPVELRYWTNATFGDQAWEHKRPIRPPFCFLWQRPLAQCAGNSPGPLVWSEKKRGVTKHGTQTSNHRQIYQLSYANQQEFLGGTSQFGSCHNTGPMISLQKSYGKEDDSLGSRPLSSPVWNPG